MHKAEYIWFDGRQMPWDEARVHSMSTALHYGLAAFEGVRAYRHDDGRGHSFRLADHLSRLEGSCKTLRLPLAYDRATLTKATDSLLTANQLGDAYIRPIAFQGCGTLGVYSPRNPSHVAIAAFAWGAYLGEEGLRNGVRCMVSSFRRYSLDSGVAQAKLSGQYIVSYLAKREAIEHGFDEAIQLAGDGSVAEGSGENLFLVFDRKLHTPPSALVLLGVTRDTIITLARDDGMEVVERPIARGELYFADEAFLCGTAAEVTPIREIDHRPVGEGKPGPITQRIQSLFADAVRGRIERYQSWCGKA